MAHLHAHERPGALAARRADSAGRMRIALAINLAMLAVALAGGLLSGSLAALADAGHVLSDVGAIALGLLGASLAARPGAERRTFGLHRGEVIAALANGLALVAIAVLVAVAAMGRLSDPPSVDAAGMVVVGAAGLAGNAAAALVLARGDRADVNLEAVLRHSAADALGSLAVLGAGIAVAAGGWLEADPVASLLVAGLILAASARLVLEPLDVLMEAAPAGLDVRQVGAGICEVEGVREVHDLHVWTLTPGFVALAAHVVTGAEADRDRVRREAEYLLRERFGIEHTTLQMEAAADPAALLRIEPPGGA